MTNNNGGMPEGFVKIRPNRKPQITFDITTHRFYFALSLREDYGLNWGDRIGIAFNAATRQILIDLDGRAFRIDKRGYVTSARFSEELLKKKEYIDKTAVKYTTVSSTLAPRYILLDETDIID